MFAEIIGTTILVFVHAGLALQHRLHPLSYNETGLFKASPLFISFLSYSCLMLSSLNSPRSSYASLKGVAITQGFILVGLIYALGQISGAHFNPAVTLSFALRKDLEWFMVFLYWFSEFTGISIGILFSKIYISFRFYYTGGLLGGLLLWLFFGNSGDLGANNPHEDTSL